MSLSGRIETISFYGILQLLCKENKTGILRVKNDNGEEYQLFFFKGSVLYAIQAFKEARFARLLIEDGVVNEKTIEQCLGTAKKKKVPLGKVLVDEGHINSKQLKDYTYRQILEIIVTINCWHSGEFCYNDQNLTLRWLVSLKINTLQLLMDALQQIDEDEKTLEKMRIAQ